MRPVPEGVTRYASLSRTNVSTTGLRLQLQPVTHQRKYYRTALLSQPATHRSKCDWTDYSAMRDRYCVTRHLPRRQPTRRADATSTRRTRSPVAETPPSSSFAIASQRSRLQRPLRQFFTHPPTPILTNPPRRSPRTHALDKPAYALRVRYVYVCRRRSPTRPDDPRGALPSHQARLAFLGSTSTEARSRPLPRTPLYREACHRPAVINR